MRRTLEWLYPGLGIKRWLLLAFAGGVLLVYSAIFAVGVFWSPQLMRGLGMGWLHDRHWAAVLLAFDGVVIGAIALYVGARKAWLFKRTGPETAGERKQQPALDPEPGIQPLKGATHQALVMSRWRTTV
jgi:hypothetical protein